MLTTYDVRIYKTEVWAGKTKTTYYVRWQVGKRRWKESFRTSALADSFRSDLVAAQRKGEAFVTETGLPVSMARRESEMSWFDFACLYVDNKWSSLAGNSRRSTAHALTAATLALLSTERGQPEVKQLRSALISWAFNTRARTTTTAPPDIRRAIDWLSRNTRPVSDLAEAAVTRRVLDALTRTHDDKLAAPGTVQRRRGVIVNALGHAVEQKLLASNPISSLSWTAPKTVKTVDKRVVVNPIQARALLEAVRDQGPSGSGLVAFFAVMYYSALRPGEALSLRKTNLVIPSAGWGELLFDQSFPAVGTAWSDGGTRREQRQLKHRARGETRSAPCPPELTRLLHSHLAKHGADAEGRLFRGVRSGHEPEESTYSRVWRKARQAALTAEEYASPLARRPYDLRHAAVSTWLSAGVAPTQVAEWAGHSVAVLLQVYAKCLAGQDELARKRIEATLRAT